MTKTQPMTKGGGADASPKEPQAETPATPPVAEEQPMRGGAFVRQADGTLKPEEQEG